MQTERYIHNSENGPQNNASNPPQPPVGRAPLGRPLLSPVQDEAALSEELLMEIARLRLIIHALPPIEQVVLRALHGLDCVQLSPEEVAERLGISIAEVHEIEAWAMVRIHLFFGFEEAA